MDARHLLPMNQIGVSLSLIAVSIREFDHGLSMAYLWGDLAQQMNRVMVTKDLKNDSMGKTLTRRRG